MLTVFTSLEERLKASENKGENCEILNQLLIRKQRNPEARIRQLEGVQ